MSKQTFDVIVIGGGPGGYVAAIRAAQLGLNTALVEHENLGGICLNWGCIPTKALLRSAEIYDNVLHADLYGVNVAKAEIDLARMVQRSRGIAGELSKGVTHLLKKNKVQVIAGRARLHGGGQVLVEPIAQDGQSSQPNVMTASHIIIATGARSRSVAPIEPDGRLIWSYKEAMTPDRMPKSLLVVGSGAIGIEFASFYRTLGAEVTVVEMQARILPTEDDDISSHARKAFEKQGIRFLTEATVAAVRKDDDGIVATIMQSGKQTTISAERLISAIGIVGNVENLGLENTRVQIRNSHIMTDEWCGTDEPGVYAIGDVAGAPWLAHKASHEGILCAEKIAGLPGLHPLDKSRIPGCTYSRPQIASIGLTETRAKEKGHHVKVGRFPFGGNGKAIALGEPDGFVKTIFDADTGALLGAHLIGAEVTELIQGFSIGMTLETTEAELMHAIFPHPTLSEMMHEATLAAYGRAIHI